MHSASKFTRYSVKPLEVSVSATTTDSQTTIVANDTSTGDIMQSTPGPTAIPTPTMSPG